MNLFRHLRKNKKSNAKNISGLEEFKNEVFDLDTADLESLKTMKTLIENS